MNLPANADSAAQPEIVATSGDSAILIRRGVVVNLAVGWSEWVRFSSPTASTRISDLATLGATPANLRPRIFIVDRGRVFIRTKNADDTYSDYGPWTGLHENSAQLVTAVERPDQSLQIVTVGAEGQVQTAVQPANAAQFGDWSDLSAFPGVPLDLDAAAAGAEGLRIYVLDASGTVWSMASDETGAQFKSLVSSEGASKIVAIAARDSSGVPQLFGVDASGQTYQLLSGSWSAAVPWL
jgi:hypothetical protein